MKICFFHLKAYALFDAESDAPIGGTLVQMHVIAKKLAEDPSNAVSFVTGDYGQSALELHGGLTVYRSAKLERKLWPFLVAPFKIWAALRRADADTYIASSAGMETGLLALYCKVHGKRMIYRTAHEWDCSGEYVRSHGFSGKCFEYGLRNAHAIVTQSEEHRLLLKEHFGLDSEVIRNSYHIPLGGDFADKDRVLWVSRCEEWKNPGIFIDLAEKFPERSFVMICPMQKHQEDYFTMIRTMARERKNLEFIEFVPFDGIQEYFDRASVFVGTSEYEGFPNTYLQACMGHTPIVSYKVNPDRFIDRYDIGYCADGDKGKLETALAKLLDDEADRKRKSENAFSYVKKNHDIEKNITAWISVLKS
jgi:glycosyltransferase involved in cell wall biosynthesis